MADYDHYESDGKPRYPRVMPHFPCDSLTPTSRCPHRRKYQNGVRLACMICHQSGVDHYRCMRRNPRTDPKPERKPPKKETRKARRAADHRSKSASLTAQRQRLAKIAAKAAAILGAA